MCTLAAQFYVMLPGPGWLSWFLGSKCQTLTANPFAAYDSAKGYHINDFHVSLARNLDLCGPVPGK